MTAQVEVLYRICPSCDVEIRDPDAGAACQVCGAKLVEIRAERDTMIGAVIDERYEVRDKLGQGGMGTVYRAHQRSIGRDVAIKVMERSYARDPMAVRRFLREARLASKLSQPNTVSVLDFGQAADGRLYMAMELIRGRTLHEVVTAEGAFSIERAVRVGVQICDALEAAHALGIIHRDLKLENVLVLDDPPGRDLIKVLDFGLAKQMKDPGSRGTESGVVVGTPRYMAPETAMTGDAVPAGDLYALGVMLGELTTGKELWEGDHLPQLVAQKLDPTPVIRRVPQPMRSVVEVRLDPEPERRPTAAQTRAKLLALGEPSAGETLVEGARDADPATTLPSSPRSKPRGPERAAAATTPEPTAPRRSLVSLAVVACVAIIGGVVAFIATRTPDATPHAPPVAAPADAASPVVLAPDAADLVTITIDTKPARGILTIDGVDHVAPYKLVVPRGKNKLALTVTWGTLKLPVTVVPDADKPLVIAMPRKKPKDEEVPF